MPQEMNRRYRTISLPTKKHCIFWEVLVLEGKKEIYMSSAVQDSYIRLKISLQILVLWPGTWIKATKLLSMTGQRDSEHGSKAHSMEGMPDCLECYVFSFLVISV